MKPYLPLFKESTLFESSVLKTVKTRKLKNSELTTLKEFQTVLKLLYNFTQNKTRKSLEQLQNDLKNYINSFPFIKDMLESISSNIDEFKNIDTNKPKSNDIIKQILNHSFEFKLDDIDNLYEKSLIINKLVKEWSDINKPENNVITFDPSSSIEKSSLAFIFNAGETDWLSSFTKKDWKELIDKELDNLYTYLNLPKSSYITNPKYLIYYIQNLHTTSKQIKLQNDDYKYYSKLLYLGNEEYDKLIKIVDEYLHSNKKDVISTIISKLQEFPELYKANNKAKKQIKEVYRGLNFADKEEMNDAYTLLSNGNLKNEGTYVATTDSIYSAKNFARKENYLFKSNDDNDEKYGLVLTYKTNPNGVILDCAIFGSVFQESEIIIEPRLCKLTNVEII